MSRVPNIDVNSNKGRVTVKVLAKSRYLTSQTDDRSLLLPIPVVDTTHPPLQSKLRQTGLHCKLIKFPEYYLFCYGFLLIAKQKLMSISFKICRIIWLVTSKKTAILWKTMFLDCDLLIRLLIIKFSD